MSDPGSLPDLTSILVVYGPLGIAALVEGWVAAKLYRDAKEERAAHQEAITRINKEHDAELDKLRDQMTKLEDRYIVKTETQLEKYHQLGESLNKVVESALKRRHRESGGNNGQD